jgi:uncharacterized protein (TIGR03382 family)
MKRSISKTLALASALIAAPAMAAYDVIVEPSPSGFGGNLQTSPTGDYDGGSYYFVNDWGNNESASARMNYALPPLPAGEHIYNVYAWNPTANSSQWHIVNVNSDGADSAGSSPNISWTGLFGTNAQWLQYPADSPTIPMGAWVKLGPGPQSDPAADGGSGVYMNPAAGSPSVYVKYQPWYNGAIAFGAIRVVEVPEPATLAIGGLSGLALLGARRRFLR